MQRRSEPEQPAIIGADGMAMLALSSLVIGLSCGLTLMVALGWVLLLAWRTPAFVPPEARILVLGMRLDRNGALGRDYRARLDRAAALWNQAPGADIALLGGHTRDGAPSEAAAGAAYLQARGVPPGLLLLEDRSRHTLENLRLYRAGFDPADHPIVVTNRFHLCRSGLMARGLGISHRLCAAEQTRMAALARPIRVGFEALLVHWYVTGSVFSALTHNRRMLARIT